MLENFRLKVFRAVAEHLSFRKAGEALFLTQPAVTLQIKTLETELGVALFERRPSGVFLTQAGQLLLPFANRLHSVAEEAQNELARLKGGASGKLVLGASTTIAQYVLPALLAEFARTFPAVQLQVFSQNTEMISEGVATGRFGVGLIEGPAHRNDVKVKTWFEDELLLVVPAGHEWSELNKVSATELCDAPLVMRERGSGSRDIVEQTLQKAGLRLGTLRIVMELDSTEAILSCVAEGLGIGFISEWALVRRAGAQALRTLRIDGITMKRNFSFVLSRTAEKSSISSTLVSFLLARTPLAGMPTGDKNC